MKPTTALSLAKTLAEAIENTHPELTVRQLDVFLYIVAAGHVGIDGTTLERHTNGSQASTSRTLKLFGPTLGLIEFFLDQNDGRRRLVRLTSKGIAVARKIDGHRA